MNQRLITEIGKSQRLRVVNQLKRTQGLCVAELANALGMSYMGVKQHCIELERLGYLDTWRRPKAPKETGRPQLAYRLTRKAHELFPVTSNAMTLTLLESAQALYGPTAAEKLLFRVFQQKMEAYLAKIKGETFEKRAAAFAKLRDAEGYMAELEENAAGLRIAEYHSPLADLLATYPALMQRLEQEMFSKVLGTTVTREQSEISGLYLCVFRVGPQKAVVKPAYPEPAKRVVRKPKAKAKAAQPVKIEAEPPTGLQPEKPIIPAEPEPKPESIPEPVPELPETPGESLETEPALEVSTTTEPEYQVILESTVEPIEQFEQPPPEYSESAYVSEPPIDDEKSAPEPEPLETSEPLEKQEPEEKAEPPQTPASQETSSKPVEKAEAPETAKPKPSKKRSKQDDQQELFSF